MSPLFALSFPPFLPLFFLLRTPICFRRSSSLKTHFMYYIYVGGEGGGRGQSKDEEGGGLVGGRSDPMCVCTHMLFFLFLPPAKWGVDQLLGHPPRPFFPPPPSEGVAGSPPMLRSSSVSSRGFLESQRRKGEGREGEGADSTQSCNSRSSVGVYVERKNRIGGVYVCRARRITTSREEGR